MRIALAAVVILAGLAGPALGQSNRNPYSEYLKEFRGNPYARYGPTYKPPKDPYDIKAYEPPSLPRDSASSASSTRRNPAASSAYDGGAYAPPPSTPAYTPYTPYTPPAPYRAPRYGQPPPNPYGGVNCAAVRC